MDKAQHSFSHWLSNYYSERELSVIAQRGCDRGTRGMAYYEQTSAIYQQFKHELWDMLAEQKRHRAPGKLMLEWFANETCNSAIPGSFTNDDGDMTNPEKFEQRVVWYCARIVAAQCVSTSIQNC